MITLFALFCVGAGIFSLVSPQTVWFLSNGWKFKDAQPSDAAIVMTRIGGVMALIVGVIIFFLN